jgi:UDP-GlcNAc3NAcA epimerase
MSDVFFNDLELPKPKYNLDISGGSHGVMTSRMLEAIEAVLIKDKPDCVLVYGDTNSTLAGALAAVKLQIPIAHVEAGLRSFNMNMPEEINRVLVDRISNLLFCPTDTAFNNLNNEGIKNSVSIVGDVMYDIALLYAEKAKKKSMILSQLSLEPQNFILVTCHRAENTDNPNRLEEILRGIFDVSKILPIVFPLHPRTKKQIENFGLGHFFKKITTIEPLPFLDMIALEQTAKIIITDSGGVQKESFFYKVPCITIRDETEWIETVQSGWNTLVGANSRRITESVDKILNNKSSKDYFHFYGDGKAAEKILKIISNYSNGK